MARQRSILISGELGMPLSRKTALAILAADDDNLQTATEIINRYLDGRPIDKQKRAKLKNAVYQAGWRNGLADNPDNALRDAQGRVIKDEDDDPVLMEGHTACAWYGWRWKQN